MNIGAVDLAILVAYVAGMVGLGQRAALAGLVVGFAGMTWIFFGTSLAWPWYALVGSLLNFAAGLAASSVWPREARQL